MNKTPEYDRYPELDDDHLWARYNWNLQRAESHRRGALRDLAQLIIRGLIEPIEPVGESEEL